ncbi:MAG: hypothetical protein HYX53_06075 [Chloroflexi bacterium]|nr:hypothetical protein [Chloroflexota bacterium]
MSEEFGVDLDEVFSVIDSSDVLVVRFHIIQNRLLVDFRTKMGVPPFLAVVPRAESVEDRFRAIKRLRPEFPFPEKVMSFAWPRSMPVLLASGVWQRLVDKMAQMGGHEALDMCGRVMEQLVTEERQEIAQAIRGAEHYQTLWERQRA